MLAAVKSPEPAEAPGAGHDPAGTGRRRQPVQARSRETVGRILDAAALLLEEGGVEAVTTRAIAERAGAGAVRTRAPGGAGAAEVTDPRQEGRFALA